MSVLCLPPSFIARKKHLLSFRSEQFSHSMYYSHFNENLHIELAF
jgi:hypothetical protein